MTEWFLSLVTVELFSVTNFLEALNPELMIPAILHKTLIQSLKLNYFIVFQNGSEIQMIR